MQSEKPTKSSGVPKIKNSPPPKSTPGSSGIPKIHLSQDSHDKLNDTLKSTGII